MVNLLNLQKDEYIRAMLTLEEVEGDDKFLVFSTRKGYIKKTALSEFANLRRVGLRAIKIEEDDDLIDVKMTNGEQQIMLFSAEGMACRFNEDEVRPMGRASRGVTGMRLGKRADDEVVAMEVVENGIELLTITSLGQGKRSNIGTGVSELDTDVDGYRLTRRGSKGVINIRLRDDDKVTAVKIVNPGDELMISTVAGQIVRISTDEIRTMGRNTAGVRAISLRDGDEVSAVSIVPDLKDEDDDEEIEGTESSESSATAEASPEDAANVEETNDSDTSSEGTESEESE